MKNALRRAFFSLPYTARRAMYSTLNRRGFKNLQDQRDAANGGYSFGPFDQHQCIFVHIPKTAGVSVSQSLFGGLGGGHRTIAVYQLVFSKQEFDRYFKFAFVRNPWDRLLSAYNFLKKGGMNDADRTWAATHIDPYENFDDFVVRGLRQPGVQQWMHFKPQADFLFVPGNQKVQVDFVGFFENIEDDFRYVKRWLGMKSDAALERRNANDPAKKIDYKDFYTDQTRRIVAEVYRRDVEALGYDFDNSSLQLQLAKR